jgi:hypothetical protein
MAEALLAAGRAVEAAPLAQLYVELTRAVNSRGALAGALHLLARVAVQTDPPDAHTAEKALDDCIARATELGMRPLRARALLTRGELLRRIGRLEDSRTILAEAARDFRALGMTSCAATSDALAGPTRV